MKIVIAHLYYDLLNLYGESGNVKALVRYLENQGVEVELKKVTVHEKMNFSKYNFVYIGSGTENNQKIALKDLLRYKEDIKKYIDSGKFLLATGNSMELFGKYIIDLAGKKYRGLNIFPYYAVENSKRMVCESIVSSNLVEQRIIGFQNRCSIVKNITNSLFEVEKGYGSDKDNSTEGTQVNGFFGTYLIGPLLVRNPFLLKYFGDNIILKKDKKYLLKNIDFNLEISAYQNSLKKYLEKSK